MGSRFGLIKSVGHAFEKSSRTSIIHPYSALNPLMDGCGIQPMHTAEHALGIECQIERETMVLTAVTGIGPRNRELNYAGLLWS